MTSSANAACSSGLVIALPPYLTTTILSWKRDSHGSASTSVAAFSSACSLMSSLPSCRIGRVLFDVGVGQVVRPDDRAAVAGVEIDGDHDLASGQVDRAAIVAGRAVAADLNAVHRHVQA